MGYFDYRFESCLRTQCLGGEIGKRKVIYYKKYSVTNKEIVLEGCRFESCGMRIRG